MARANISHPEDTIQNPRQSYYPLDYYSSLPRKLGENRRYPVKNLCDDWIFSSASNVHVAVDKAAFKSFTYFESYVLTVAKQRPVPVCGIGRVELKIRCKPGSRDSRVITLNDVLYVPSWACNLLSDTYFIQTGHYEHRWDDFGVRFYKITNGRRRAWGYTENFCGQDRLVVARKTQGRSPMLEDKDREVWSVNVNWPQSQQDKWAGVVAEALQAEALRRERETRILAEATRKEDSGDIRPQDSYHNGFETTAELSYHPTAICRKTPPRAQSEDRGKPTTVLARQVSAVSLDLESRFGQMMLNSVNKGATRKPGAGVRAGGLRATFNANKGFLRDVFTSPFKE